VKRYLILPDADITAELRTGSPEPAPQPVQRANISLKEVAGHAAEIAEKERSKNMTDVSMEICNFIIGILVKKFSLINSIMRLIHKTSSQRTAS